MPDLADFSVASLVASFQSSWGINALFSLLQSAAMGGYGAPIVAGAVKGAAALGAVKCASALDAFKAWTTMGNFTMPCKL